MAHWLDGVVVALLVAWACVRAWRKFGPSKGAASACGACPAQPAEQNRPGPWFKPGKKS